MDVLNDSSDKKDKKERLKEMLDDPVCGLCLYPDDTAHQSMYEQDVFYFCSEKCKTAFDKDPEKYIKK